jgi:hypothetical protein
MIELFILRPGVEHFLPHEDQDALTFNELDSVYGVGVAARDLSHFESMPLRLTGTPVGRTDLLGGPTPFLVMSWRLLHLLESLGDFPHQVLPAHLMQDRDDWQDHPPIDTTSFVVCNLHQHLHVIDFKRCVLTPYEVEDGMRRIDQLATVEGVTVPPLFRQDNWWLPPLIPRSTRDAILAAGMLDIYMPPVHGDAIRLSDIKPPLR